jgi:tartrate-resistant acid phosphatase type 5
MVQILITADTGSGSKDQYLVAESMQNLLKKYNKINDVFLLGDNIYETGVTSVNDKQFKTKFEDPYKKINKKFHLCLGNHDYGNSYFPTDIYQHQIEYTKLSNKWNLPQRYYNLVRSPCEFFFLDTNFDMMSESVIMKQFHDIKNMIQNSNQKWKILCGHHTWRCIGGHGNAEKRHERFMQDLLNVVDFDLYMCGHDHCKNIIKTKKRKKNIHSLVIGTGGKKYDESLVYLKNLKIDDSELLFHSPNLGVCVLEATKKNIKLTCYNEETRQECSIILN